MVFGFSLLSAPEAPLVPDRPTTAQPDQSLPKEQLRAARTSGAVLGALTAALLALINPLKLSKKGRIYLKQKGFIRQRYSYGQIQTLQL